MSASLLNPCLHSCPPGCSPPADPSGLVVFRAWRLAAFSGSLSLYFYLSIPFSTTLWLFQPYKKSFRASMSQQNLACWCFEFLADILTELLWSWWFHVPANQANGAGDPGQWEVEQCRDTQWRLTSIPWHQGGLAKWLKVVTHVFEGLEKYQEAIENVRKPPAPLARIHMACQRWEKGNLYKEF